jgi:hypothetical protein
MDKIEELEKRLHELDEGYTKMIHGVYDKHSEHQSQMLKLNTELKELKKRPVKRWRADKYEKYYNIDEVVIIKRTEYLMDIDNFRYKTGNYYKTKEQAEQALDLINIECELVELIAEINGDWVPDFDSNCKLIAYIAWCHKKRKIVSMRVSTFGDSLLQEHPNNLYCKRDFLKDAIDKIGKERLTRWSKR